ncbi:type II secretion system F family protein [Paracerasibacillus soli]|uniref:Type II secretion system F family protein n=1 Tax=Paracerasibacillus soli TaxID=480284 RepID=A0ABU5CQC7_9BACI|nr:type II secretion system F family protein [Virgibacillus soli]MDY0408534.1 type II secretion system F family protein [Virgibacillus soli]
MRLLYTDDRTYIIREFNLINRRVENGEMIERAIEDFANRSDVDDIRNFADVFITCKRTGGDLVEVIKRTSDIITDKIEIQQDIKVLVSQKKFESKIMAIAPLGIILFLKMSSPTLLHRYISSAH